MMTINRRQRIRTIKIDANIDETLRKFQKTMGKDEEIVNTEVAGNFLVVVIESTKSKNENLLLG